MSLLVSENPPNSNPRGIVPMPVNQLFPKNQGEQSKPHHMVHLVIWSGKQI